MDFLRVAEVKEIVAVGEDDATAGQDVLEGERRASFLLGRPLFADLACVAIVAMGVESG